MKDVFAERVALALPLSPDEYKFVCLFVESSHFLEHGFSFFGISAWKSVCEQVGFTNSVFFFRIAGVGLASLALSLSHSQLSPTSLGRLSDRLCSDFDRFRFGFANVPQVGAELTRTEGCGAAIPAACKSDGWIRDEETS